MHITDHSRTIAGAVVILLSSLLAWPTLPVHAQEPTNVHRECVAGIVMLASAFVPQSATDSLKYVVDEWLGAAAALPPDKAADAYRKAIGNALVALRKSGVSVTERDILVYRYNGLRTWRAYIKPPISAGGGTFESLPAIDKELELIVSLLPAECRI